MQLLFPFWLKAWLKFLSCTRRASMESSCKPHHSSVLFQSNYVNEYNFFLWFVSVRFVRHWIDACISNAWFAVPSETCDVSWCWCWYQTAPCEHACVSIYLFICVYMCVCVCVCVCVLVCECVSAHVRGCRHQFYCMVVVSCWPNIAVTENTMPQNNCVHHD